MQIFKSINKLFRKTKPSIISLFYKTIKMRSTKLVSMWPVALVGALRWEGPVCRAGKVLRFFTGWKPSRKFPVDMASFAVNLRVLLVDRRDAKINAEVPRGFIESDFLSQQLKVSISDIEAKADDCRRVYF